MDKIAKAEFKNVPVGAIFFASLGQAVGVLASGALQRKYPANATLAKWGHTLVGGAGAVLIPQTKKYIGEATAKSLAIGFGTQAVSPWLGQLFNMILYPPAAAAARRTAQKRVAGAGSQTTQRNPGARGETDLNGVAAAKSLGATLN